MSALRGQESGEAVFSPDRVHRYTLTRRWGPGEAVAWVGLNPSTADESALDPTLRRVLRFSTDWGFDSFVMLNLFAFRATEPKDMKAAADPVGPDNDEHIRRVASDCGLVVGAWGTHGGFLGRDFKVRRILAEVGTPTVCLGTTRDGHPRHPLYVHAERPREVLVP